MDTPLHLFAHTNAHLQCTMYLAKVVSTMVKLHYSILVFRSVHSKQGWAKYFVTFVTDKPLPRFEPERSPLGYIVFETVMTSWRVLPVSVSSGAQGKTDFSFQRLNIYSKIDSTVSGWHIEAKIANSWLQIHQSIKYEDFVTYLAASLTSNFLGLVFVSLVSLKTDGSWEICGGKYLTK